LAIFWIVNTPLLATNDSRFLGWIFGTALAYVVQASLFYLCGVISYRSFYRSRPAAANALSLLWESAWLGLSVSLVVMRMLKLILAAALEVGRIDKPFLADGAGKIGPLLLDSYPTIFRQDILSVRYPLCARLFESSVICCEFPYPCLPNLRSTRPIYIPTSRDLERCI